MTGPCTIGTAPYRNIQHGGEMFCDVTSHTFAAGWFAGMPGIRAESLATESLQPYLRASLLQCEHVAVGFQLSSVITCATLTFAAIGQGNRMRFSADCPVQKAFGTVTDTLGAVSLFSTMVSFGTACYQNVPREFEDVTALVTLGPGYIGFVACLIAAVLRATMHWLTPTPGNGAGCCSLELPVYLREAFDLNGDGKVTFADVSLALRDAKRAASAKPPERLETLVTTVEGGDQIRTAAQEFDWVRYIEVNRFDGVKEIEEGEDEDEEGEGEIEKDTRGVRTHQPLHGGGGNGVTGAQLGRPSSKVAPISDKKPPQETPLTPVSPPQPLGESAHLLHGAPADVASHFDNCSEASSHFSVTSNLLYCARCRTILDVDDSNTRSPTFAEPAALAAREPRSEASDMPSGAFACEQATDRNGFPNAIDVRSAVSVAPSSRA